MQLKNLCNKEKQKQIFILETLTNTNRKKNFRRTTTGAHTRGANGGMYCVEQKRKERERRERAPRELEFFSVVNACVFWVSQQTLRVLLLPPLSLSILLSYLSSSVLSEPKEGKKRRWRIERFRQEQLLRETKINNHLFIFQLLKYRTAI